MRVYQESKKVDLCSNMPAQNDIDDSVAFKEPYFRNAAVGECSLLLTKVVKEGLLLGYGKVIANWAMRVAGDVANHGMGE